MKMVLYLGAATIGVAAIVFLVIHLAKGGSNTASGTSTTGATPTAAGGQGSSCGRPPSSASTRSTRPRSARYPARSRA